MLATRSTGAGPVHRPLWVGLAVAVLLLLTSLGACNRAPAENQRTPAPAATALPAPSPSPTPLNPVPVPRFNLQFLDYLTASPPTALAAAGADGAGQVYLGAGRQLLVLDLSNPAQPRRLGDVVLPRAITHLAAVGRTVYAATENGPGLYVVDARDPTRPAIVASYFPGRIGALVVSGSIVYVAAGNLRVVDASDPVNPVELAAFEAGDRPGRQVRDIALVERGAERRAYLRLSGGAATDQIAMVDLTRPTEPSLLGLIDLEQPAAGTLAASEDRLYLLAGQNGRLQMVNATDPANLRLGATTGDWQGNALFAAERRLYLAVNGRLQILDAAGPGAPSLLAEFTALPEPARLLAVAEGRLYAAGASALSVVDIAQAAEPRLLGVYRPSHLPALPLDVAASEDGSYAVAAAGQAGLQVISVDESGQLAPLANLDTAGHAWEVIARNELAFVADEYNGLRVVDLSDPRRPREAGAYDVPGPYEFFHYLAMDGDLVYVADGSMDQSALRLINVADPAQPFEVGFWPLAAVGHDALPARIEAVAADLTPVRALAYVAAGTAGLRVVDVSDPAQPVEIGAYETPGRAADLAVAGQTVYLLDGDLRIVDVSNPENPTLVGFVDLGETGATPHLALRYPWLIVASSSQHVLDVSDPARPVERTTASFVDGRPALAGERLFVAGQGLFVFEVTSVQP